MNVRAPNWSRVRLHVVSGKGGTGKSTVAAALAWRWPAVARRSYCSRWKAARVLLRSSTPPAALPGEQGGRGRDGGIVYALPVDAEAAMLEYRDVLRHQARRIRPAPAGAIDFATTIAPGLREGCPADRKASEAVKRGEKVGRPAYDAGGPGRSADWPDHTVPQREHRDRRAREGRTDPHPGWIR